MAEMEPEEGSGHMVSCWDIPLVHSEQEQGVDLHVSSAPQLRVQVLQTSSLMHRAKVPLTVIRAQGSKSLRLL